MKRVLIYIVLLLLALIGVLFARLNAGDVPFDVYFSQFNVSLALLLYAALALGVLLGITISLHLALRAKRETSRLRKRLTLSEQEVKNLREIPIKGHY
jgi:lipopolysaccharide assembly protein A